MNMCAAGLWTPHIYKYAPTISIKNLHSVVVHPEKFKNKVMVIQFVQGGKRKKKRGSHYSMTTSGVQTPQ